MRPGTYNSLSATPYVNSTLPFNKSILTSFPFFDYF
jgi:hypothetical protein